MSQPALYLTGATGYLGHAIVAHLEESGVAFRPLNRNGGFDLADPFAFEAEWSQIVEEAEADPILIHAAAMSRQDVCEREPDLAWRVNAEATGVLTSILRRRKGRIVYVSTDLVFDGEGAPYSAHAEPRPITTYGRTKSLAERYAIAADSGLVIRIPLLYGASFDGQRGASDPLLAALKAGRQVHLFTDEWRTPLDVCEAAKGIVSLAMDRDAVGIRHMPGPERLSRYELGERIAVAAGFGTDLLVPSTRSEYVGPPRQRDCSLA